MVVKVFTPSVLVVPGTRGYIAGEAPDGIATLDNVPARVLIDLFERETRAWVRRTMSATDGTYRISGLPLGVTFDVIGRDPSNTFGDVIVSRVLPYSPPRIATQSLAFVVGMPPNAAMEVNYGTAPFAWTAVGLPPGLILLADGVFDPQGLPTTAGTYQATITVEDAHGSATPRDYAIVVTS